MARVPITVYLELDQLAAIERRAAASGKTRSAWVGDVLVRGLEDRLLPLDHVLLDQLTKVRAGIDILVDKQASPSQPATREELRTRVSQRAGKLLEIALALLKK